MSGERSRTRVAYRAELDRAVDTIANLRAEVERLKAERDEAREWANRANATACRLEAERDTARELNKVALEALEKYAAHRGCNKTGWAGGDANCSCGLDAAIARLKEAM